MTIITLGPASGPRRDAFAAACLARTGALPRTLSWTDFLSSPARLAEMLTPGSYLRIDSPDQDPAALAALYRAAGAPQDEAALAGGAIGAPSGLAAGIVAGIATAEAITATQGALISTSAADAALAFDKSATLARLAAAGIPTPTVLPDIAGFDALTAAMAATGTARVFVKLRHGSAAAGMVALARAGDRWQAVTTAVCDDQGRLHATRAVRRLTDRAAIAALVDRLAPLGLHVEAWLPKIGIAGRVADLRLVLVEGGAIYPVLRTSRHPMTNLHLGGDRGPVAPLVARIGVAAWAAVLDTARAAAAAFPASHALGIDIAVLADGRRHAVLEANIFGDFVKDLSIGGLSPHEAQVERIRARLDARAACPARDAA
ncbi:STM4014 family protein [Sphingomonas sanxanigenens]|uniref:ATP-grasp domain-containing protein n=1 Tax=Sphingomonas sanxanigenens DSM 19645 = NX02 TaxID=1123269 RepID=W0A3I3_9SPHN|nr:STM4014 family protein [Sphingomonas sanxanigenens]AHE52484.1 hypothetical protein NX02_03650 [Sphingomonas sanxanigenens DSM 19645 = NX02]